MLRIALTLTAALSLAACQPLSEDPNLVDTGEEDDPQEVGHRFTKPPRSERPGATKGTPDYLAENGDLVSPPLENIACGVDEHEPNDYAESPAGLGTEKYPWYGDDDVVLCEDDVDWFRIQNEDEYAAKVWIRFDAEQGDLEVEAIAAGGTATEIGVWKQEGLVEMGLFSETHLDFRFSVTRTDGERGPLAYEIETYFEDWSEK